MSFAIFERSSGQYCPVFFGLLVFILFPINLNMTRLSSTFAVAEGLVDVIAHLDNEAMVFSRSTHWVSQNQK